MANDDTGHSKAPSIPSWQQSTPPPATSTNEQPQSKSNPELDKLEQARLFLEREEVKNEPRERKVTFLEKKGLHADNIQKLLSEGDHTPDAPTQDDGMKTIHDSTTTLPSTDTSIPSRAPIQPPSASTPPTSPLPPTATLTPQRDLPPIITYPEFLLKPQKPPPLVTLDRLLHATYALAGISALTWSASKYLIAPMLESLTIARHDLQSTTLTSLTTLNDKLESTVSHIPYIPPLHASTTIDILSDTTSDSDPTELFHRDIATQTTPTLPSRRSSTASLTNNSQPTTLSPTQSQSTRLNSLHTSLSSLLSSTELTFASDALSTQLSDLQSTIDKIDANSQPLYSSYDWRGGGGSGSSAGFKKTENTGKDAGRSEAERFKAEIRALKGAFLSSRNFPPSVRPGGYGSVGR